jgi:DNA-binding winged helix-turn-helix (wHTH) protein
MRPVNRAIANIREARTIDRPALTRVGANDSPVPLVTIFAKPGDMDGTLRELALRIERLLRERLAPSAHAPGPTVITVGELVIDSDAHRVTVDGGEVALTGSEFKLLVALLERRDRVYPRGKLLSDVWASHALNRTRKVDTHVKRLRDKLKSAGRFIQTVRGIGYRFSETPSARGREAAGSLAQMSSPNVPTLRRASLSRSFA